MEDVKKGTTTIGLVCKEGVVMATEMRATMGTLIAHKTTQKLFKIDDNLGLTVAGVVGDAQTLARYITAEVELYKLKRGQSMTVKSAATLTSNILAGSRFYPYWVGLILGGIDREGNHVYALDMVGGAIPDDYVTTGSGSPYVYGVLEDHYEKGLSVSDGMDLAIRALHAAMKRDAASGDGYSVAAITKEGFLPLDEKEIQKRLSKLKLT
ncbi:MAG: proteasome endopeptidase complex, archaeal, beta subunit [Euryarchaeota archaeon RBG_19FT_COMBO_56_21]|nr:MAG: proteasome endopeptidase complex, archaeal, beta subunit [Euryarchaeota archaeon RBG_19FT_COMBO_56_21]